VPYNTLLHKQTRESVGIKLKNSVVIIDEAHNLLDTIAHIHSSEIRGDQLIKVKRHP
jgi:chromosome transmission fidelity protein 1